MKKRSQGQNLTAGYALIQGFHWMNFAAVLGFTSIYLLDMGFSNTEIGLIIAVAGILSAVMQPLAAGYADKPSSMSLKKMIMLFGAVMLGMSVLLLAVRGGQMKILTALFYGAAIMLLQLLTPLINSLGTESMNQGKKLNFGVSRGVGSGTYAAASYILGLIVAGFGAVSIPITMIFIACALLVSLFLFPFQKGKTVSEKVPKSRQSPFHFLVKYRRFSFVLCGCVFLYIGHLLLNSFTFQIVESKGGGSQEMGLAMALAAILELPAMFGFGYMIKKAPANFWLCVSGVFYVIKTAGTLLVSTVSGFYFVQIFQMFSWALITVSSVYYVNSVMEEQDAIKGQAYMTMTYTLGSVLGSLIGGALIDRAGVNVMLIFATVSAGIGMIIILAAAGNKEKKKRRLR